MSNYISNSTRVPSENEVTLRLDHSAGANTRLFGRLTHYRSLSPIGSRIPGPLAVKRTPDLLPFCHPIAITGAEVAVEPRPDDGVIDVTVSVRAADRTGVEMESLTGAAVAALSLYDTAKAFDRAAVISELKLRSKRGGKSGDYAAG